MPNANPAEPLDLFGEPVQAAKEKKQKEPEKPKPLYSPQYYTLTFVSECLGRTPEKAFALLQKLQIAPVATYHVEAEACFERGVIDRLASELRSVQRARGSGA